MDQSYEKFSTKSKLFLTVAHEKYALKEPSKYVLKRSNS